MVAPSDTPVVLSPVVNPFWSESARDEAMLRAIRPADLPDSSPELRPAEAGVVSPPKEEGLEAVRMLFQGLVSENARLWSERDAWQQGQRSGGWPAPPTSWHSPSSGFGGQGQPHGERGFVGSMFDVMRTLMGAQRGRKEEGLLGALCADPEREELFSRDLQVQGQGEGQGQGVVLREMGEV